MASLETVYVHGDDRAFRDALLDALVQALAGTNTEVYPWEEFCDVLTIPSDTLIKHAMMVLDLGYMTTKSDFMHHPSRQWFLGLESRFMWMPSGFEPWHAVFATDHEIADFLLPMGSIAVPRNIGAIAQYVDAQVRGTVMQIPMPIAA